MSETLYKGKFLEFKERKLKSGGTWEYFTRVGKSKNAVYIIPETEDGGVVTIFNHRPAFNQWVFEFPAGLMDDGESPGETAVRELLEETGYEGTKVTVYPISASNAGTTDEKLTPVKITSCKKVAEQNLDPDERIEILVVKQNELLKTCKRLTLEGVLVSSRLLAYAIGKEGE